MDLSRLEGLLGKPFTTVHGGDMLVTSMSLGPCA